MLQTAFSFTFIFPLRSAIKRLLVLVRGTRFEDRFCFRFGKRRSREKWRHVFRFNTPFIRLFNWPTNNNLPYLKRQSNWRMVQLSSWCVVGARLCQNDLFWPIIGASSGGCVVCHTHSRFGSPHFWQTACNSTSARHSIHNSMTRFESWIYWEAIQTVFKFEHDYFIDKIGNKECEGGDFARRATTVALTIC